MSSHTPVGRLEFLRTLKLSEEERSTVPGDTKGKFEWMNARNPMIIVPAFPSASQVRKEATVRSSRIFRDWETLHNILKIHEDVLRKRWVKKSQDQRQESSIGSLAQYGYHAPPRFPCTTERAKRTTSA